jgi:hypothetical protein
VPHLPHITATVDNEIRHDRPFAVRFLATLVFVTTTQAHASDRENLLQKKFQIAEIFEAAGFISKKCPGLHVIEDAVIATAADLGVTLDDDTNSPEYKVWAARGQKNAKFGYEKDPVHWCKSMWRFFGPIIRQ